MWKAEKQLYWKLLKMNNQNVYTCYAKMKASTLDKDRDLFHLYSFYIVKLLNTYIKLKFSKIVVKFSKVNVNFDE